MIANGGENTTANNKYRRKKAQQKEYITKRDENHILQACGEVIFIHDNCSTVLFDLTVLRDLVVFVFFQRQGPLGYSFQHLLTEAKMAPKGKAPLPKTVPPAMKKNMKGKKKASKEELDQLQPKSKNKKEEEDEEVEKKDEEDEEE